MDIGQRIQTLRKRENLSQEQLAAIMNVSRQAVSKWESAQTQPDLENIIALSNYFAVSTDYLLKGEEPKPSESEAKAVPAKLDAGIFTYAATALNIIGLGLSCAVWYEWVSAMAAIIGLIFMAIGVVVFGTGQIIAEDSTKRKAKSLFWRVNIWLLTFIPLSLVFNIVFGGLPAPYPNLAFWRFLPLFWLVYLGICLSVMGFHILRDKSGKNA